MAGMTADATLADTAKRRSRAFLRQGADVVAEPIQVAQETLRYCDRVMRRRRWMQRARRAVEEARFPGFLELSNEHAKGGRRQVHVLSGARKAPQPEHVREGFKLAQAWIHEEISQIDENYSVFYTPVHP